MRETALASASIASSSICRGVKLVDSMGLRVLRLRDAKRDGHSLVLIPGPRRCSAYSR